jgi:hypothetical protein
MSSTFSLYLSTSNYFCQRLHHLLIMSKASSPPPYSQQANALCQPKRLAEIKAHRLRHFPHRHPCFHIRCRLRRAPRGPRILFAAALPRSARICPAPIASRHATTYRARRGYDGIPESNDPQPRLARYELEIQLSTRHFLPAGWYHRCPSSHRHAPSVLLQRPPPRPSEALPNLSIQERAVAIGMEKSARLEESEYGANTHRYGRGLHCGRHDDRQVGAGRKCQASTGNGLARFRQDHWAWLDTGESVGRVWWAPESLQRSLDKLGQEREILRRLNGYGTN